jgi:hypothetical protein
MGKGSATHRSRKGRGRPRKQGVRRAPSGRISQAKDVQAEIKSREKSESEKDAMAVAVDARRRHYDAPDSTVKDQRWSTAIGRLFLSKEISEEQYEAAQMLLQARIRYMKAIGAPGQPRNVAEPMQPCVECGAKVLCEPCAAESKDRKIARWDDVSSVLIGLEAEIHSALPRMAIDNVVFRDIEMNHLNPWLRIALNRFAVHFAGIKVKRPARRPPKPASVAFDEGMPATEAEESTMMTPSEFLAELEAAMEKIRAAKRARQDSGAKPERFLRSFATFGEE